MMKQKMQYSLLVFGPSLVCARRIIWGVKLLTPVLQLVKVQEGGCFLKSAPVFMEEIGCANGCPMVGPFPAICFTWA